MNLLREYIRASLVTERGDADYKEQMVKDVRLSIQTVNDEIESRHPAHAFPNSEHVEGSIGHVLDLISLKKKYGRSRSEHETQAILDKWRGRMGAGSGKGMAAWTLALAGGGLITADMVFLGGTFTAMGLSGAGLNIIHEVMAGNAVDDDLKEYIRWDPKILEWMDDKKEDELEDEWIDLLFEHISKNPKDDLATFISINDFANKKLGRPLTGEKIQIRTNELRKYIRSLLNEATEYDDHFRSMMDSGYEGVKQAMELADSLGMQPQDLPWTKKHVEEYLYDGAVSMGIDLIGPEAQKAYAKLLAQTGWTWEDWVEAGRVEFEAYKKSIGLHESAEYEDDEPSTPEAKLAMLVMNLETDQALTLFEMLGTTDQLDLDLLAVEILKGLQIKQKESWSKPTGGKGPDPFIALLDWQDVVNSANKFVTGDGINRIFDPSMDSYQRIGGSKIWSQALRQTVAAWKERDLRESGWSHEPTS